MAVPPGTPAWGAKWKQALRDNYLSSVICGAACHGSFYSYRDVYLDLDPIYKDRFGRPLMRMTIDFHDNELKAAAYLTDKLDGIVKAMGANQTHKKPRKGPYDITTYQTTHLNGGAVMYEQRLLGVGLRIGVLDRDAQRVQRLQRLAHGFDAFFGAQQAQLVHAECHARSKRAG